LIVNIKVGIRFGGMTVGMIVMTGNGTEAVTVTTPGIEAAIDGIQKRRTVEGGPSDPPSGVVATTCQ
jgi:hypothetical protein